MRILAKPKYGTSNLINDRLYGEIEKNSDVEVISWSPIRMLLCRYDLLHVHWPENVLNDRIWVRSLFKVFALMCSILWIKLWGRKLVWTAHNAVSHDGYYPKLESLFWRLFIPRLDGIIALSPESLNQVESLRLVRRSTATLIVPHGNYCGVYADTISRARAREILRLPSDAQVLLNLGIIRRYKKVERMIELGREDPSVQVLIAGNVGEGDYEQELRQLAEGLDNIHLHFKFIADDELQLYLRASDLFALPYDKITNSGSAILALSYDLPVLAPDLPCFDSLQKTFGDSWVSTYSGAFSSATLQAYCSVRTTVKHSEKVNWGEWEWSVIASKVCNLYKSIITK
ncbi:MAG: hypothetical protein CBB97_11545 [Candidatus Endolissoclinum sp. TMED37]|nr:MAG: hypothetical protein CBB97_11545 [Candidatus Endolissoclinum sp. TMED37]|tara:strand:- start:665 stop:1696 length:1032 start_codon:yes stop_codon:yes gene_type:complete